ncbi:MAG: NrsF family protein [Proteobacteria bacterium]|nr:NrsF family protein [Pseudomonadota bacterium]
MSGQDQIDATLRALGHNNLPPPPLSAELEAELATIKPVKARRPLLRFALHCLVSIGYGAAILWLLKLRPDLGRLPTVWILVYCAAWLSGFLVLGWFALVPGRGNVMPNWRYAGIGAVFTAGGFIVAGLIFDRNVPNVSHLCNADAVELVAHGTVCLKWGLITATVPVLVGMLLIRGSIPVGSRWVGAALGAGGGSLGGLMLHLHCHNADPLHMGFVHGGVVVVAALLGALIIPRFTDV